MQIRSIQLKNIKSHRDTMLSFSPGINVLSGPNGIGKSTVFEAIGYALFGVDAQSFVGNVDRFVSIGAKRGEIAVVIEIDGVCYRVTRTVGTPAKWLLAREMAGAYEVEEHKDIKETEARLKELLGLDNGRSLSEQFELVIGPFQNEFLGPFVEKRPTTRRNKFDEILGIDSWRKTFSETNGLLKAIKNRIDVLEGAIGPLRDQVAELPEKKVAFKQARSDHDQAQATHVARQQQLQSVQSALVTADQQEQALKTLANEVAGFEERIRNGNEMIGQQKLRISEAESAQKIVAETRAGKEAFEQAEARLTALREKLKQQRQIEKDEGEIRTRVARLAERLQAEEQALKATAEELDRDEAQLVEKRKTLVVDEQLSPQAGRLPEVRRQIEAQRTLLGQLEGRRSGLEEGSEKLAAGQCPFFQEPCLNLASTPPGDVFSARFKMLDEERRGLEKQLVELTQDEKGVNQAAEQIRDVAIHLKGVDEQLARLADRRKALAEKVTAIEGLRESRAKEEKLLAQKQEELKAFSGVQDEIENCEQEKAAHQQARDLHVANLKQAGELEKRRDALAKFEKHLAQLQRDLEEKKAAHAGAERDYDPAAHGELRQQKDALTGEVGALGQQVKGLEAEVKRLVAEIDKLKKIAEEIAAKQEQIKNLGEKEQLVKFLRNRVFNKVSASLSERFREEISQRANSIYRIIAEVDEELAWGDNYQIVLRDMQDGALRERVDDQLSGGQTMSAVVALRLAMLQTIGARVAFFDEPTSNLDATRRENLAHAFRAIDVGREEVTEHWYDQLFLISHDVAFTEVTDQIISLERE